MDPNRSKCSSQDEENVNNGRITAGFPSIENLKPKMTKVDKIPPYKFGIKFEEWNLNPNRHTFNAYPQPIKGDIEWNIQAYMPEDYR